jgi:exodeoxyribonuclease VII small subunit
MAKSDTPQDLKAVSFEAALGELEDIVQKLESGETDLDGAIKAYERGVRLKQHCAGKLSEAQLRVDKIETDAGGEVRSEPFETD